MGLPPLIARAIVNTITRIVNKRYIAYAQNPIKIRVLNL